MPHLSYGERSGKMSEFIMKPKVDFCFKELMEEPEVRRGFISAVLGIRPEDIVNTTLLPTHLRKDPRCAGSSQWQCPDQHGDADGAF